MVIVQKKEVGKNRPQQILKGEQARINAYAFAGKKARKSAFARAANESDA